MKLMDRTDGIKPLPALQAGIALLPFLAFGLTSLLGKLDFFGAYPASPPVWYIFLVQRYLLVSWIIMIGLAVGIALGFPRWTCSYLGWALVASMWWQGLALSGFLAGVNFWLVLLGVFLLGLLIRRSLSPVRIMLTRMWSEWTVPSLGLYILYGFIFMLSDENHNPQLPLYIAAVTLTVSLGAWGYFRSGTPLRRVLFLAGGLFFAWVIDVINYATWDFRAYYGFPESTRAIDLGGLFIMLPLILIILATGYLALLRSGRAVHLQKS